MADGIDPRTIGELLALIAHDLRNPLSAMHSNMGFLQSLEPIAEDTDAAEAVEDGLISCDGLSHIIDNIDLFGRALRGAAPARSVEPVDLSQLAREVVHRSVSTARSHGLSVQFEGSTHPVMALASRELAQQALTNLVRNSIQHGGSGTQIRISVRQDANQVIARIEDAGAALAGEVRQRAFTAEGQLETKSVRNGRYSRGMGLYCAALAASAGGGSVQHAESAAGNAFELSFPVP